MRRHVAKERNANNTLDLFVVVFFIPARIYDFFGDSSHNRTSCSCILRNPGIQVFLSSGDLFFRGFYGLYSFF